MSADGDRHRQQSAMSSLSPPSKADARRSPDAGQGAVDKVTSVTDANYPWLDMLLLC